MMKTVRCIGACGGGGSARLCALELPSATEVKSNTAQQTRATGTARDGGVVHAITKTNDE